MFSESCEDKSLKITPENKEEELLLELFNMRFNLPKSTWEITIDNLDVNFSVGVDYEDYDESIHLDSQDDIPF